MQVTSSTNNIYTSNTNNTTNTQDVDKKYKDNAIPRVEELLDEEGMAFLDELVSGMSEKDATAVKLMFSMQLSIRNMVYSDGNVHIERESGKLDAQSIFNKLDELSKNRDDRGYLADATTKVINELKSFYSSKIEVNNITRADSAIDDFLEELYNTNSIKSASELVKGDIKSKVDEYAQALDKELNDTQRNEMIDEYKQKLLKEYKDILEASSDEKMTLQQQVMIKTLLDENTKEGSLLKSLLKSI
jgi:hypothetical protein